MDADKIKQVRFFNGRIAQLLKQLDDINSDLDVISESGPLGENLSLSPDYCNPRTISLDREDKLQVVQFTKDRINRRRMLKEKEIEDAVTDMYNATKEISGPSEPEKWSPSMGCIAELHELPKI